MKWDDTNRNGTERNGLKAIERVNSETGGQERMHRDMDMNMETQMDGRMHACMHGGPYIQSIDEHEHTPD